MAMESTMTNTKSSTLLALLGRTSSSPARVGSVGSMDNRGSSGATSGAANGSGVTGCCEPNAMGGNDRPLDGVGTLGTLGTIGRS